MENTNNVYARDIKAYLGMNMDGEEVVTLQPLEKYLYDSSIEVSGVLIPEALVEQSGLSLEDYMEMAVHPYSLVVPFKSLGGDTDFVSEYPFIAIEGRDGTIIAETSNIDVLHGSIDMEELCMEQGEKMKDIHIGSALNYGSMNVDIGYVNGELTVAKHNEENVFDDNCKIQKQGIFYYESDIDEINYQSQDFVDKFIADSQKLHTANEVDADTQYFIDHCSGIHMNDVVVVYGDISADYEIIACAIDDSVVQELDSAMQQNIQVDEEDLDL